MHKVRKVRTPRRALTRRCPPRRTLQAAVAFIAEHAKAGKVMVHCKGGHGRGAAVAFAYLMSEHGGSLTPEEAQARLNAVRLVRKKLYLQDNLQAFYKAVAHRKGASNPREMM